MTYWANFSCDAHKSPSDCPDSLIAYNEGRHAYGLIVHDGGSSFISIQFCPWCGAELLERFR